MTAATPTRRKETRAQHDADNHASSVQVAVRVRPMLSSEAGTTQCIDVLPDPSGKHRVVRIGGDTGPSFTFDEAFPGTSGQRSVFETRVVLLVRSCLEGYNATVLAYGQTGSGKTHTIMGPATSTALQDEATAGVIPRALRSLFDELEKTRQQHASDSKTRNDENDRKPYEYEVRVQFLEVYGEAIHDLLSPQAGSERLTIRDVGLAEPEVLGATQHKVETAEEALLCLSRGMLRRVTGATAMNKTSSRSHAILSVLVEQTSVLKSGDKNPGHSPQQPQHVEVKRSKFNFVDLAGSERQKRTHAVGKRMKEGIDINKGLLVLGNVISALGDPKKMGKTFVPYRDSKLTRLLKGSLGGNHKTLMIACVSPSSSNLEESLNCLRYANRAKNIQNNAIVNVDAGSRLLVELRGQVQALATELLRVREGQSTTTETHFSTYTLKTLAGGADSTEVTWTNSESAQVTPVQPIVVSTQNGEGPSVRDVEIELQRSNETLGRLEARLAATSEELTAAKAEREMYRVKVGETHTGDGDVDHGKVFLERACAYEREIASLKESLQKAQSEDKSPFGSHGPHSVIEKASKVLSEEKAQLSSLQKELSRSIENSPMRRPRDHDDDSEPGSPELTQLHAKVLKSISLSGQLDAEEAAAQAELSAMTQKYSGGGLSDDEVEDVTINLQDERVVEGDLSSERRRQQLEAHLLELSKSIDAKQELIEQLHLSQKKYATMREFYEEKLRQMEDQVKEREMEREQLAQELKKLEESNPQKKDLQQRLAKKDEYIAGLRQKKSELLSLTKVSSQNESQIVRLKNDVVSMKQKKVELQKQISHERKHHADEIKKLKKEAMKREKETARYKKLSDRKAFEAEKAQRVAKSRLEEVGQLRTKYKEAEKKLRMQTLKRGVMEKAGLDPILVGRRDTRKKNIPKRRLNVDSIRDYLDGKIADVSRKEAIADKVAVEWEEHLELVSHKEYLLSHPEEGASQDEIDALNVQIHYKEGRIRQLAQRIGKEPSTSVNEDDAEKESFLDERGFKSLIGGSSDSTSARVASRVLFGMVVRERRRVAALARTASSLDERVMEAEERAFAIDAAFRSHMEEERHQRASMSQNQQEQILSLMAMVQEQDGEPDENDSAMLSEELQQRPQSISSGRIDSRALVLANERISVLEQQLREMEGEKDSKEVYKVKEAEAIETLAKKNHECEELEGEVDKLRSTLRRIKEAVTRKDEGSDVGSQEPGEVDSTRSVQNESLIDCVLEIVSEALHPGLTQTPSQRKKMVGRHVAVPGSRAILLSPSLERQIELMNSSDSEDEEIPEWAGDIMADLALIAAGEMPPSLRKTTEDENSSRGLETDHSHGAKLQKGNVFDRLTDPGRFTGVQKHVTTGNQVKHHTKATDKDTRKAISKSVSDKLSKVLLPQLEGPTNAPNLSEKTSTTAKSSGLAEEVKEQDSSTAKTHKEIKREFAQDDIRNRRYVDTETDRLLDELLEDNLEVGNNRHSKVEDYTQQNVFDRLQRTTTHSYAVKQNAPTGKRTPEPTFEAKNEEEKPIPRKHSDPDVPQPHVDSAYTQQNVFERLQKTTTQAYAGKQSSSAARAAGDQDISSIDDAPRLIPMNGGNARSNSSGRASPAFREDVFERLQRTTTHAYAVKHHGTMKASNDESDRRQ